MSRHIPFGHLYSFGQLYAYLLIIVGCIMVFPCYSFSPAFVLVGTPCLIDFDCNSSVFWLTAGPIRKTGTVEAMPRPSATDCNSNLGDRISQLLNILQPIWIPYLYPQLRVSTHKEKNVGVTSSTEVGRLMHPWESKPLFLTNLQLGNIHKCVKQPTPELVN